MVDVESVSKEYPPPSEVRSELVAPFRTQHNGVVPVVGKAVYLVSIGVLDHRGIVVVLRLDICRVYTAEPLEETYESVPYPLSQWVAAEVISIGRQPGSAVACGYRVNLLSIEVCAATYDGIRDRTVAKLLAMRQCHGTGIERREDGYDRYAEVLQFKAVLIFLIFFRVYGP